MEGQQTDDDWEDLSKFEVKITVKERRASVRQLKPPIIPSVSSEPAQEQSPVRGAPVPPPKPIRLRSTTIDKQQWQPPPNIAEIIETNEEETKKEEVIEAKIESVSSDLPSEPVQQNQIVPEVTPQEQPQISQEPIQPIKEETKILSLSDVDPKALEIFIPRFFELKKEMQGLNEFNVRLELQNLFSLLEGKQHFRSLWTFDEKKVILVQVIRYIG